MPINKNKLILAYDFGTSAVKAALIDADGRTVAHAVRNYSLMTVSEGQVEQYPEDWWKTMCEITAVLLQQSGYGKKSVVALNICAQMCGTVPVNQEGKALMPCMTWLDTRSASIARRITHGLVRIHGYGILPLLRWLWYTNGVPNLAGRDPTSKIIWIKEQRPDIWEETAKLLDVKDYLVYRCCRRFITTPDVAHLTWLMDSAADKKQWCRPLLDRLDLDDEKLPDIHSNMDIVGQLDANPARELGLCTDTIVLAGAGDLTASALGAGSFSPDQPHLHLGSSAWLGTHLYKRKVDVINGTGTICSAVPDRYLLVAAQQSGALSLNWAMQTFGRKALSEEDYAAVNADVEQTPAGAHGLVYTPWLLGECVPRTIAANRAEFFNISSLHSISDMYRAVMEGVAMNIRWAQLAVNRHIPPYTQLRTFGGAACSDTWCQILADCLQVQVAQMELPRLAGVYGSAMLASVVLGWHADLEEAAGMARQKRIFEPDTAAGSYYEDTFAEFLSLYRLQKKLP